MTSFLDSSSFKDRKGDTSTQLGTTVHVKICQNHPTTILQQILVLPWTINGWSLRNRGDFDMPLTERSQSSLDQWILIPRPRVLLGAKDLYPPPLQPKRAARLRLRHHPAGQGEGYIDHPWISMVLIAWSIERPCADSQTHMKQISKK